jgi:predicted transcriptional regulator
VEEAVERYFLPHRFTAFPVARDGEPVGLIDVHAVERVPAEQRAATRVEELVNADPDLVIDERQDVAELVERPAFQRSGRAVVRTADGGLGLISVTDVNRALRAIELASQP